MTKDTSIHLTIDHLREMEKTVDKLDQQPVFIPYYNEYETNNDWIRIKNVRFQIQKLLVKSIKEGIVESSDGKYLEEQMLAEWDVYREMYTKYLLEEFRGNAYMSGDIK